MYSETLFQQRVKAYMDPAGRHKIKEALIDAHNASLGSPLPLDQYALGVANALADWRAPADVITAGILYCILKEMYSEPPTLTRVAINFGEEVRDLVGELFRLAQYDGVHWFRELHNTDDIEHIRKHLPWFMIALHRAPLAVVIKIANHLARIGRINTRPPEERQRVAVAARFIFAPLAERLGIRQAKRTLEDAAFRILEPEKYAQIMERYGLPAWAKTAEPSIQALEEKLAASHLTADVTVAPSSYYHLSLAEQRRSQPLPLATCHPILILTDTVEDCYRVLEPVHALWQPKVGQVLDYLAAPKPNGYRALHTRVHHQGEIMLVITRPHQFNDIAEYGYTAQWRGASEEMMPALSTLQATPSGRILTFTPDMRPIELPAGATPIDFAYALHGNLGHQCTNAVVNGRHHSLSKPLHDGDVVRILTSRVGMAPSTHWLDVVKTARARKEIRRWLDQQNRGEMIQKGREKLELRLQQQGIANSFDQVAGDLAALAKSWGFTSPDDLLVKIGVGERSAKELIKAIQRKGKMQASDRSLQVKLISFIDPNFPKQLAQCCNPLPPDDIVGYVTARNVVKIHRATCPNVAKREPLLMAEWAVLERDHRAEIEILALDRLGLVRDVSTLMAKAEISMTSFHADPHPDGSAVIRVGIGEIPSEKLRSTLAQLEQIGNVRYAKIISGERERDYVDAESILASHHRRNPYTLNPVKGDSFYGRHEELDILARKVRDIEQGEAVLLWGARRIGKTSLLWQYQEMMSNDDHLIVFLDMQRLSGRTMTDFLWEIVKLVAQRIDDPGIETPNFHAMRADPLTHFRNFLENNHYITTRRLILILDEFQVLSELQPDEKVSHTDLARYFRSIIQHRIGVSVIFSGGGVLDKLLQEAQASFMLEVARHQPIGLLELAAARQLITNPVNRVAYDEEVTERLLKLTAGHPYYLQMVCGELVDRADREKRREIRAEHLELLIDDWLIDKGEQYFAHLWGRDMGVDRTVQQWNRLLMVAMANLAPAAAGRWITIEQLEESGICPPIPKIKLWRIVQNLAQMGTLEKRAEAQYRITVELCEVWLRENYTVPYVLKEMNHEAQRLS